jgi:hypothetical protein
MVHVCISEMSRSTSREVHFVQQNQEQEQEQNMDRMGGKDELIEAVIAHAQAEQGRMGGK